MKRWLGYMGAVSMAYLFFICLGISIGASQKLNQRPDCLLIPCSEENMSMFSFQEIKKGESKLEDTIESSGFSRKRKGIVSYPEFNRQIDTEVIYMVGDGNCLTDTQGVFPLKDTTAGCIISQNLSYQLFGTLDSVGMKLEFEQRSLFVRAVIPMEENIVFIPYIKKLDRETSRSSQEGEELSDIILDMGSEKGKNSLASVNLISQRYNIADAVALDTVFYKNLTSFFGKLLSFLCIGYFIIVSVKHMIKWRKMPFILGISAVTSILFFILLRYLLEIPTGIPDEMIPTKWSDFEFWSELLKKYKEQIVVLFRKGDCYPYKIYADALYRSSIYSMLSLVLFGSTLIWIKKLKIEKKTAVLSILIFLSYGAFVSLYRQGFMIESERWFFLVVPCIFMIDGRPCRRKGASKQPRATHSENFR